MCHRESQRRFGDVVDAVTKIGSVPGGGFTALFGADTGNDQPVDTLLRQPDFEAGAGKSGMAVLVKGDIWGNPHTLQRPDIAAVF